MTETMDTVLGAPSPIQTDLDFDRDGKQIGELHLPHSPHEDAWGVIPLPVAVLRNGTGPTALLVGGVHGDEYEGPIALSELVRQLNPKEIHGRLIVLPALNAPAVKVGRRTSPIDGLNLARTFPGDPNGTPTRQIAHYIASELVPRTDFVLDLHAGGSSLEIMTVALLRHHEDPDLDGRNEAAMRSFGAPLALAGAPGEQRTLIAAAARQQKVAFAVELGCAGRVSPTALAIARAGLVGFLAHAGIMSGEATPYNGPLRRISDNDAFVYASTDGVFEPFCALGEHVIAGQPAGRIHDLSQLDRTPTEVSFGRGGLVFARRGPGLTAHGNCLAVVAAKT